MRFSTLAIVLVLLLNVGPTRAADAEKVRYQLVQVSLDDSHTVQSLIELGFDLEGSWEKPEGQLNFVARSDQLSKLSENKFEFKIVIDNLESFYATRLREAPRSRLPEGFGYGSMGGYYTYNEMVAQLDSLHALFPEIVSEKDSIGVTYNGHILWAVKISDNPATDENESEVLFTGLHHAREPVGMMSVVYFMWWLVDHYQELPRAQYLVQNREMWFVPCVNPDGYIHNQEAHPDGGGMWRKNLRDNNEDNIISSADGVDLNRNYGNHWGYDNSGSSPYQSDPTYRGPGPFSEPETQALQAFIDAHHFTAAINYHTFSDLMIFPYSYAAGVYPPEPDHSGFRRLAIEMTNRNGYHWGNGIETVGYVSNGDSDDWMYAADSHQKMFAFTSEVGGSIDGFWPPQNRLYPLVKETVFQNQFVAMVAGAYPTAEDVLLQGSGEYPQPGESVDVLIPVENLGLQATSSQCELELTPLTPGLSLEQSTFSLPNFSPHDNDTLQTSGQIALNLTNGTALSLEIKVTDRNGSFRDTVHTFIGTPLFTDDAEQGMIHWTSDDWNTEDGSYNQSQSFTDSPGGFYQSNHLQEMTLKTPLDFSRVVSAELIFHMRCLIENDYDFSQVLASTDSLNWTPLSGEFTRTGSGYGVQTVGEPGYDGDRGWLQEHIDLSDFAGSDSLYLRFQTNTDQYVSDQGWQIDDIALFATSEYFTPHAEIDTTPVNLEVPYQEWDQGNLVIQNTGDEELTFSIDEQAIETETVASQNIPRDDLLAHIREILTQPQNIRALRGMEQPPSQNEENVAESEAQVVITDSVGDYVQGQPGFVYPDIHSVSVQYNDGPILSGNQITVQFQQTISDTIAGVISLDADQNHATGEYPAGFGFLPPSVSIGAEYEVIALPFGLNLSDSLPTIPAGAGVVVDMSDTTIIDPSQVLVIAALNPFDHSELIIRFNPNSFPTPIDPYRFNLAAAFIGGSIADSSLSGLPDVAPDLGHGTWGEEVGASWLGVAPTQGTVAPNSSAVIQLPVIASVPEGNHHALLNITTNSADQTNFSVPVNLTVQPDLIPEIMINRTEIQDTVVIGLPKTTTVELSNTGEGSLGFKMSDTTRRSWLTVRPFIGEVESGESQEIQLSFNTNNLIDGETLNAHLFLVSNDPNHSPITIPVEIMVGYSTIADPGDLNRDGFVDVSDLSQLAQLVLSNEELTPYQFWAGDYNQDGYLDIRDVLLLLRNIE